MEETKILMKCQLEFLTEKDWKDFEEVGVRVWIKYISRMY